MSAQQSKMIFITGSSSGLLREVIRQQFFGSASQSTG